MSVRSVDALQQYLRRLCDEAVPTDDAVLLQRFVSANDREAFEQLIARHGPMVLGTARRLAANAHDAEDVFQAVFLSFARLAKTIRQGRALPAFLHKTTCRIAAKIRQKRLSRTTEPVHEPYEHIEAGADLVWREVRQALDEELQRLPERLRSPLLLCYLSGLSRDEAAKQLGWSLSTFRRRLEQGRNALRLRLERRGIVAVGLALAVLEPKILQASLSTSLVESTLSMVYLEAALVPVKVSAIALGSAAAMKGIATKSLLVLLVTIAVGVGIYTGTGQADTPKDTEETKENAKLTSTVVPVPEEAAERLGTQIATSRRRAIEFLKNQQNKSGTWESAGQSYTTNMDGGITAFVTLSLLEGGVSPKDAAITKAVNYLAKLPPQKTYVVSLQTQVLARVDVKKHADTIQKNVDWLLEKAMRKGNDLLGWAYPENALADGSNTHFAVFALHIAARSGAKVDDKVWNDIRAHYVRTAVKDGWPYNSFDQRASQSMTLAALVGLTIATNHLKEATNTNKAIEDAWKAFADDKGSTTKSEAYLLHVTAELGQLKETQTFKVGDKEIAWFANGAAKLVKNQNMDGSWKLGKGIDALEIYSTAAALYFLGTRDLPRDAEEKKESAKPTDGEQIEWSEDPLPKGSRMRFGTSLFRQGTPIAQISVSADGKMAVVLSYAYSYMDRSAVESFWKSSSVFDLTTGRVLYSLAPPDGTANRIEAVAISPDGKTIVSKHGLGVQSLHCYDSATGRELRKIELPQTQSWVNNGWLAFSPDSKTIAVTSEGSVVRLIDIESGETIHNLVHKNLLQHESVDMGAFSPDGKLMVTSGECDDNYLAHLWDVKTGKELRGIIPVNGGRDICALVFSPDGKTLASNGWEDDRLRLWDVDTGKERKAFPEVRRRVQPHSISFSPDGETVASASDSIHLYDATTGKDKLRIDQEAVGVRFTDDGKTLTGAVMGSIIRWDAKTGKPLTPEAAGSSIVQQILVAPDGKRVITRGFSGDAHIWDGTNGKHLRGLNIGWELRMTNSCQRSIAMSPDGRFLIWSVTDTSVVFTEPDFPKRSRTGSRISLYDIAADKLVKRFPALQGDVHDMTFAADGKRLVTVDHYNGLVQSWDFDTGKEERSFPVVPEAEKKQTNHVRLTALSDDGKILAVAYNIFSRGQSGRNAEGPHIVRLWDVASGKETYTLNGHMHDVIGMAFSPDGRLLATVGDRATGRDRNGKLRKAVDQVFIWETATGKRVSALPNGLLIGASAVAFSRDGRFLATALPTGQIRLWEVATWTVWNEFKESHRDRPTALTFAPGWQLFSGSLDTTVLAWDIRPPRNAMPGSPLEAAWDSLALRESGEAFKAEGRFLAAPSEVINFLAERIKLANVLDEKKVQQWIADLDSNKFVDRESASKALGDLGQQAKPCLEAAIKTSKSTEVLDRAEKLLDGLNKKSPEHLRQMRAVLVLELIDDNGSKNLLKKWAVGAKGALLTEEAAAALDRLEGKTNAKR